LRREEITVRKAGGTSVASPPKLEIKEVVVEIVGDSPLLVHTWNDKAQKNINKMRLHRHMDERDPEKEFHEALYHLPGGKYGFPTAVIKQAVVHAAKDLKGITKAFTRGALHFKDEMVEIKGGKPVRFEHKHRIGLGKTVHVCYIGQFKTWRMKLVVAYNAGAMTEKQVIGLFKVAGVKVGIGQKRPQVKDAFGRFHVKGQEGGCL
jgi:hypothetical protein